MIEEININLLECQLDSIGHFCNCQCVFGKGMALQIKNKYPEAYAADVKTKHGDKNKMGTFSYTISKKDSKHIVNCYTQFGYGYNSRYTDYEAVCNALTKVEEFLRNNGLKTFGLPNNAGCTLGGGDWTIVRAIIDSIFLDSPIKLYICNYSK